MSDVIREAMENIPGVSFVEMLRITDALRYPNVANELMSDAADDLERRQDELARLRRWQTEACEYLDWLGRKWQPCDEPERMLRRLLKTADTHTP